MKHSVLLSRFSVYIQKFVLVLQLLQFGLLSRSYITGTAYNDFTLFKNLFADQLYRACTDSGCWSSLTPFIGSLYASVAFLCLLGVAFRQGRELRLLIIGIAGASVFMAFSRYLLATPAFYPESVLARLSLTQLIVGIVVLVVAFLPYPHQRAEPI
jgi:ABC-type Fe3+-siderophore transport system permease subunit